MKKPAQPPRPSLRSALRRAHLSVVLMAATMVGLAFTVVGLTALRAYSDHNLQSIARTMLYTVEASVVFEDRTAAEEALALVASTEDVGSATVFDRDRHVLAEWRRPASGALYPLLQRVERYLMSAPVYKPILHDGQTIGFLLVTADGGTLMQFLVRGMWGMLACLLASAFITHLVSRRTLRDIMGPLGNLAQVAHAVRNERAFSTRVPPARIAELNELGDNFNALLDELEAWQSQMQLEYLSLAHKAAHDALTGLPNRASFEEQLLLAVREAAHIQRRVAVLFLDNDRFKEINDRQGHAAGDAVLVSVARRLRTRLREGDLVARLGGDEFGVLLSDLLEVREAHRVAEDILAAMATPIVLPNGESSVLSVSIGIAVYPDHASDAHGLYHAADVAMYRAKRGGGSGSAMADPITRGEPQGKRPTEPSPPSESDARQRA
jgi:diguanylate cyclase (GGDEF)-like protein